MLLYVGWPGDIVWCRTGQVCLCCCYLVTVQDECPHSSVPRVKIWAVAVHVVMDVWCRITNAGLPSGLARLPYLKSIGLKRNCLTSVPRMLGQMHSLQEIYLEDNNELEVCLLLCRTHWLQDPHPHVYLICKHYQCLTIDLFYVDIHICLSVCDFMLGPL